jgi:DNA polymerase III sliding clamp (beta) subunit (PCNA family)
MKSMRWAIQAGALKAAAAAGCRVVPRASSIPILRSALIEAGDGNLTVTGTNLNCRCAGVCAGGGAVAVQALLLCSLATVVRRIDPAVDGATLLGVLA